MKVKRNKRGNNEGGKMGPNSSLNNGGVGAGLMLKSNSQVLIGADAIAVSN
jgi:hypothetical protein